MFTDIHSWRVNSDSILLAIFFLDGGGLQSPLFGLISFLLEKVAGLLESMGYLGTSIRGHTSFA